MFVGTWNTANTTSKTKNLKKEKGNNRDIHVMLEHLQPKYSKVRNCTTDVPTWLLIIFGFSNKGPISPKYGKHRMKQKLETVPP